MEYDQQQTSQPITDREMYATLMQEEKVRNVISQINPDNQLADLQMRLRGFVKDPFTEAYEKIDPDAPEPSPLLIRRYIGQLGSVLNGNTTFSNLSTIEINRIMKVIIEWLVDDLNANAETYGIGNDYTERTRIGNIILTTTFLALKRALNGTESRRIFGSLNMNDNFGGGMPQRKQGSWWQFWKK